MFGKPKPPAQSDIDPKLRRMQADATLDWWRKNFKWVLLCGPVLFTLMFIGGAWWGLTAIKNSPVYKSAWQNVQTNPQVTSKLGKPITEGFWAQGQEDELTATFVFNIKGPLGTATVQHNATRQTPDSADWQTQKLEVYTQTDQGKETITLIELPTK